MKIIDKILEDGEYFKEICTKDTIDIHHTAGGHRPDYSIDGWEADRSKNGGMLPVGTAYVIGGLSITKLPNGTFDNSFDGKVYRAFDDKYWAHHLGTTQANNKLLNQKSVGIEVCNYGPLTKTKDGKYLNYVNKEVPAEMVVDLNQTFRGYRYFHKYTTAQIAALKELILDIAKRYNINVKAGITQMISIDSFALSGYALKGSPGIWSHTNFRSDKTDMFPQPELIAMLKTL